MHIQAVVNAKVLLMGILKSLDFIISASYAKWLQLSKLTSYVLAIHKAAYGQKKQNGAESNHYLPKCFPYCSKPMPRSQGVVTRYAKGVRLCDEQVFAASTHPDLGRFFASLYGATGFLNRPPRCIPCTRLLWFISFDRMQ